MIVLRQGNPPNFTYVDNKGARITNKATIQYIKSLVIPPKYINVKIHISQKGGSVCEPDKLTYTGVDEKGRTQYGYSKCWKSKAGKKKYKSLVEFGKTLPKIRSHINKILSNPNVTKTPTLEVCIALIIRIVNMCHFRLGNLKYKDMYKSYGIITIERRHLNIKSANKAVISFIGKKAVKNDCIIECKTTIAHLANMIKDKSSKEAIFSYDLNGNETVVRATDINTWMRNFGADITSKMFRTYATNVMLIGLLREMGNPEPLKLSQRKKNLNIVLDEVSDLVHNTRAVCKKEYTHPDLITMYLEQPRRFKNKFMGTLDPEPAFLSYLRSTF